MSDDTDDDPAAGRIDPIGNLPRRTAMALLGLSSLGVLSGPATAAGAESSDRLANQGDPARPWERDVDAQGHDLSNLGALEAETVHSPALWAETDDEYDGGNVGDRRLVSDAPIELHVDPDGDDANDGSEETPLATLQAAFDRLPFILQHSTTIHVNEGVHTNDDAEPSSARHLVNHQDGAELRIVGDPDNPENHVLGQADADGSAGPQRIGLGFLSTPQACEITGVTFNATVEPQGATVRFTNCVFNAPAQADVATAIGGSASLVRMDDCVIGPAGTTDYLLDPSFHQNFQLKNCTVDVNNAVLLGEGGGVVADLGGNDVSAPFWIEDESASTITVRGHAEIGAAVDDGIPTGPFDVIRLEPGEHRAYYLDDGEQFENVLIDQRAPDSSFTIRAHERSDWVVRNVGFLGVGQVGPDEGVFQMVLGTPEGETGTVENVFIDGRGPNLEGSDTEIGGLFARGAHAGHIEIRHTYIAGMGNNAAYMSNPGKDERSDGSASHHNCYHRDNTVSQFRIGTPNSSVHNCVGIVNDPDGLRGNYPGTTSQRARCVWGRHYENQVVENSAFYYSANDAQRPGSQAFHAQHLPDRSRGDRAELILNDCHINEDVPDDELFQEDGNAEVVFNNLGHEPTTTVLNGGGVPTSPEMAARGEREIPNPEEMPGLGIQYEGDAIAVTADHFDAEELSCVEFTVRNNADRELTVTHVTIEPHDESINELHDEHADIGKWVSELHIAGDVQAGVTDPPGSAALPTTIDMANDGWSDEADEVAIMSGGSSAIVALSRFEADGTPVDMPGKQVDIELDFEFADGETGASAFTLDIE